MSVQCLLLLRSFVSVTFRGHRRLFVLPVQGFVTGRDGVIVSVTGPRSESDVVLVGGPEVTASHGQQDVHRFSECRRVNQTPQFP